ncbi:MAG: hypothetical protein KC615_04495, partial [Anaerolineae bacterium]|nr:hypothetical protein [Anaerolineae bacterium]
LAWINVERNPLMTMSPYAELRYNDAILSYLQEQYALAQRTKQSLLVMTSALGAGVLALAGLIWRRRRPRRKKKRA